MEEHLREGRSLAETPTWAFASVIFLLVALGLIFHCSLKQLGKWLDRTRRKSLLAALEKIKQELMVFGVLSLTMGHWIVIVAKICVKSSVLSSRFYPCSLEGALHSTHHLVSNLDYSNHSVSIKHATTRDFCSEGHESFASYESLEQLHRFMFVLGITHVSYSFAAIALAMLKIYSWGTWENEAKAIAIQSLQDDRRANARMRRLSTFIDHHTSHPWSQHRILVWLLCFIRQFWGSINRSDYMALRLGFITAHQLPLSYNFHNYMLRSMEDEFCDIVGVSIPLWIYAICCIFLDFHGSNIYFWLSFLPAILILLIGTKLYRVVVKLAVEIMDKDSCPHMEIRRFRLRDELFWFGKPRLVLWLIQLISFQNAFEMATFIWSLWEIKEPSCFMENRLFLVIRLLFGVISQFWCSFITFPLYVIITQMGSRFKKSLVSENVRKSLFGWQRRVKAKHARSTATSTTPLLNHNSTSTTPTTISLEGSSTGSQSTTFPLQDQAYEIQSQTNQSDDDDDIYEIGPPSNVSTNTVKDNSCPLPPP
ncbi:hypothetical protein UlMin_039777 [Ulmus minor]